MEFTAIYVIDLILATIGIIFCLMYLVAFISKSDTFLSTPITYINLSLFIFCTLVNITYFLGKHENEDIEMLNCKAQAILTASSGLAISLLIFVTAFSICLKYTSKKFVESHPYLFNYGFVILAWLIVIIFTIFVIISDKYGITDYKFCLVNDKNLNIIYSIIVLAINFISFVFLLYVGISIAFSLKKIKNELQGELYDLERLRILRALRLFFKYFIVVFLIFFIFISEILFKKVFFEKDGKVYNAWNYLLEFCYALIGGITIFFYAFNEVVWEFYRNLFCDSYNRYKEDLKSKKSDRIEDTLSGNLISLQNISKSGFL